MNTETKHTPTPWETNGSAIETVASPGAVVGWVNTDIDTSGGSDDANAELIVRAVNAHDALVAVAVRASRLGVAGADEALKLAEAMGG